MRGLTIAILIGQIDFLPLYTNFMRMSTWNFFPCITRLQHSLPAKCLPLSYVIDGFNFTLGWSLLSFGFFLISFPISFSSLTSSLSFNYMLRSGCSTLHEENSNWKMQLMDYFGKLNIGRVKIPPSNQNCNFPLHTNLKKLKELKNLPYLIHSIPETVKTYTVIKVAIKRNFFWGGQIIIWTCINVDMQATFVWREK